MNALIMAGDQSLCRSNARRATLGKRDGRRANVQSRNRRDGREFEVRQASCAVSQSRFPPASELPVDNLALTSYLWQPR